MNRSICCLCRCRQLLLTWPRSQPRPLHLRRLSFSSAHLFSTRQLHTDTPNSSATHSLRPALDEHIDAEPTSTVPTPDSAVDVASRIRWLLSSKHELDAIVLFQRNRQALPLSVWNAVLSTLIHKPRLLSFIHQLPSLLSSPLSVSRQPSLLSSLDLFLADLQSRSLQPDATTYQLCMDVAASVGEWQRVLHWWHEMETRSMRPTLTVAHHVMTAMTETCQPALIKPFYLAHFTSAHSTTNTTTITPADSQQPPPLRPTALTYHYLLSATIQLRDTDVSKLWKAMKATLPLSALDITLHTSYLAHLGGEGRLDEMMKEYTELKRKAVRPTLLLLSTVLTPLSSAIITLSSPSSSASSTGPIELSSGRLGKLLSSFYTVLEDLTLHSAHNHNSVSEVDGVDSSISSRSSVASPLLNPSLYALIIATFSALRDTHRTLRYYQQYCEYCVSVLSSTASSSAAPSLASPSFSSSTHSAILHSMLRLYALQGDVGMMEGYLGEIVSGGLDDRETMESVLVGYMRADITERVRAVHNKWHTLADTAAMNRHLTDELVRYYVRKGQTAALEQLMHDGVMAADVDGYGKLIEACCLSTDAFDAMWNYHERMKAAHFLPSSATYAHMLRAVNERGSMADKQCAMQLIAEIAEGNVRLTDDAIVHTLLVAVQVGGAMGGKQHKQQLHRAKSRLNKGGSRVRATHIHALLTALPVAERTIAWEWARVALSKQTGDNYELMLRTYEDQRSRGQMTESKLVWRWKNEWNDMVQRRVLPTPLLLRLHLERQLTSGEYGRFVVVYEQAMEVCDANVAGLTAQQVGKLQVAAMEVLEDRATAGDVTSLPASHLPLLMQSTAVVLRSIKGATSTDSQGSQHVDLKRVYPSLQSLLSHLRALLFLHTEQPIGSIEPVQSMDSRFVRIKVQNEQQSTAVDNVQHGNQRSRRKRSKQSPPLQRSSMRTPHPVDVLAGAAGGSQPSVTVYVEHEAAMRWFAEQLDAIKASVELKDGAWQSMMDSALHEVRSIIEVL